MANSALRLGFGLMLGLGLMTTALAADPTTSKSAPEKAPSFSDYVFVADVLGEVVKADDNSVTIRVTWNVPQGGNSGRPRISGNHRNYHNPFMMRRPNVKFKQVHHDYTLEYVDASLVRLKNLPPKLDEKGRNVGYNEKELSELRKPVGTPGYVAEKSDVTPGTYVELHVIRDKTIPLAKQTEDDLRIKYVFIWGHDPNPPKDMGASKNPPKKN